MYAQITTIDVPMNMMATFREVLETTYLSIIRMRPGFRAGYLLEKADDPDKAELVLFWDDHASVENFNRTGMLQTSINALAAEMPGVHVKREGYIVKVAIRAGRLAEAQA